MSGEDMTSTGNTTLNRCVTNFFLGDADYVQLPQGDDGLIGAREPYPGLEEFMLQLGLEVKVKRHNSL